MEKTLKIELRKSGANCENLSMLEACRPEFGIDALAASINAGIVTVFDAFVEDQKTGCIVCRISGTETRKTLILIHAVSMEKSVQFSELISGAVEKLAKENGCHSLRVHSERVGLDCILKDHGFCFVESVWKKEF